MIVSDNMATITSEKKFSLDSLDTIELRVIVNGREVYNICQEYPMGVTNCVHLPARENLDIYLRVSRFLKDE